MFFFQLFLWAGGCLIPSFFISPEACADTVFMKNGKEVKGLVVEEHADRVILSTERGEIPLLLSKIVKIKYDDPEHNFMQVAKDYEKNKKWAEALAYYEKALEVNPNLEEARVRAAAMRNRFWASSAEGPIDEIEKQQAVQDAWEGSKPIEHSPAALAAEQIKVLKEGLGLTLEKKGQWTLVESVDPKKDVALSGLKKNDRLVAIDGDSVRYLPIDAVRKKFLSPRLSNFTLEYERDCFVVKGKENDDIRGLGIKLKLGYNGLAIEEVKKDSPAEQGGLKAQDLLTHVNGVSTRYTPLPKVNDLVKDSEKEKIAFTVRRNAMLTRK